MLTCLTISPILKLLKSPLDNFVWQKVHSLIHPVAISTMPTIGFRRIFGRPTLDISVSSKAITFLPFKVDSITDRVFPKEFGPNILALSENFSTVVFSALGKHPATTNGFDFSCFIR